MKEGVLGKMEVDYNFVRYLLISVAKHGYRGVEAYRLLGDTVVYEKDEVEVKKYIDYMVDTDMLKVRSATTYFLGWYGKYSLGLIGDDTVWDYVQDKIEEKTSISWPDITKIATEFIKKRVPEIAIQYGDYPDYKYGDGSVYYRKDGKGNNIPVIGHGNAADVMISDDLAKKVLSDFPECKDNLYVMYQGKEFKISNV